MKTLIRLALMTLVALLALAGCGNLLMDDDRPASDAPANEAPAAPRTGDEIVVRLAADADPAEVATALNADVAEELAIGETRYVKLRLDADADPAAAVADAARLPQIDLAYEEVIWDTFLVPSDPLYAGHQYAPQIAGLETAWDDADIDTHDVVIAVIDTGINTLHQDFGGAGAFVEGLDAIADVPYLTNENRDDDGHGTHVAGILGARGNNGTGIAGVSWGALLMPVRSLGTSGGTSTDVAQGIEFVTDAAIADPSRRYVINMSLGGLGASPAVADAIARAVENDVVVVAAMGNDGIDIVNYPAAYPGVISVGSTNGRDEVSTYSTRGRHIDVAAPGEDIWSLSGSVNDGYLTLNGTSMASPFVAGLAGLLLTTDNALTPAEVKEILTETAVDLGDIVWDNDFGYGRVDAAAALAATADGSFGGIEVTVTNGGTPIPAQEVLLLTGDGSTVLHSTVTAADGTALFPMLPTAEAFDVRVTYLGNEFVADDVTPATPVDTAVAASYSLTIVDLTAATTYIEYAGTFDDVDARVTVYDGSLVQIAQASYRATPPGSFDDLYPIVSFAVADGETVYVAVDAVPGASSGFEAGYTALFANSGSTSSIVPIAVAAGTLPPDPGSTFGSATSVALDSYYPFYLSVGEVEYFELNY